MKLSWEDEDNEEDPNNPMDLQSSDEDEGDLYTLTATEKYRAMKVTQTNTRRLKLVWAREKTQPRNKVNYKYNKVLKTKN